MPRWEPGSRERLQAAALELFSEQGFENTTVGEITDRVGVDRRTFFRHFADKRDVLFAGGDGFRDALAQATAAAPAGLAPLDAIAVALSTFAWDGMAPRAAQRQRQQAIAASPELTERELTKLDALTTAFAQALHERGVADGTAGLAAHSGVAIFRTAYERWLQQNDNTTMSQTVDEALAELRDAVSARTPPEDSALL